MGDSYTGNYKVGDSSPTGNGENCPGHVTSQAPFENRVVDDGASLAGGIASICNETRIERIYSSDQRTNRISLVKSQRQTHDLALSACFPLTPVASLIPVASEQTQYGGWKGLYSDRIWKYSMEI